MMARWRMFLWEQWRTAGMIGLVLCGLSLLIGLVLHYLLFTQQMSHYDAAEQARALVFGIPVVAALVLTARQDGRGHIAWNFEPRLLRLPVPMPVVFTAVIGTRILCVLALLLVNWLLALTYSLSSFTLPWVYFALPLYMLLVVQSLAWSYKRVPLVTEALMAALVLIFLVYRFTGGTADPASLLLLMVAHPLAVATIPPAAIGLMAYGVYLERRDEHFGPPDISELLKRGNHAFSPLSVDAARSPLEAQLWYENRRIGRLLPLMTLGITAFTLLVLVATRNTDLLRTGYGHYLPLVALPVAALLSGALTKLPRSRYAQLRPVSDGSLAAIQMLAQLRALLFACLIAGTLSFLFIMSDSTQQQLLCQFRSQDLVDTFDIFILVLRPLVFSALVSWALLSPLGFFDLLLCYLALNIWFKAAIYLTINSHAMGEDMHFIYAITYSLLGVVIIFAVAVPIYLRVAGKSSWAALRTQSCLGVVVAALIWFGSEQARGMPGVLAVLVVGSLVVLPISFTTLFISKRRHNAVK